MSELTMAERDAQRADGFYWILTNWGGDLRGPAWQVALWDRANGFYGPGWFLAGLEEDLPVGDVLEVNETRLVPPDASATAPPPQLPLPGDEP